VVSHPSEAPAALTYASLVAFRSSSDEPSASQSASDWHHILGHTGIDAIKNTAKVIHGMKLTTSNVDDCEPCGLSKSKRDISRIPQTPPTKALGKVHVDVVGPITTEGVDGERYWPLITDGKTRRMWCFTSDSRAVLGEKLIIWCRQMKTSTRVLHLPWCLLLRVDSSTPNLFAIATYPISSPSPPLSKASIASSIVVVVVELLGVQDG
jgi:hypothetical protein